MGDSADSLADYIRWRGDLSFCEAHFCEIDALILCQISYLHLEGLVPARNERGSVLARELPARFAAIPNAVERRYLGAFESANETAKLFADAFATRRFGELEAFAYESVTDEENAKQFAAISFLLPDKTVFIAFRGTDDTIAGWKEDFTMAFLPVIPAQEAAAEYTRAIYAKSAGRHRALRLGGHSKGGNLAIYAAACSGGRVRGKVLSVYNFDGPGFSKERLESPEFCAIESRTISFTPELSIIGMLFEHSSKLNVVASGGRGIQQHNLLLWKLDGPRFARLSDTSAFSKFFDRQLKKYLAENGTEQRRELVSSIFDVIAASEARTLTDLKKGGIESAAAMLSAFLKKKLGLVDSPCKPTPL